MPRPSIVIGIGGTGVAVLSWVKKNLLETHGSMDNVPVRIVLVDLVEPDVKTGGAGIARDVGQFGADEYKFQYHDLDLEREFVQLARDATFQDIEAIKRGLENNDPEYRHFRWYCNGFHPPSLESNLRDGGGQLRQLGRLALLHGLHRQGASDALYGRLHTVINEIGRQGEGIDIHIAGSFAGGTGSGVFLDIAYLARKLVEESGHHAYITGFFAMPEALADRTTDQMSAAAFSAWRELNRLMTVQREDGSGFELLWGSQGDSRAYNVERPVYDHVYLAARPVEGIYRSPEEGLFPMIGEAISFFIDSEAGDRYVQEVRSNLSATRVTARYRDKPVYSTFYLRSWKLPLFHVKEQRRYQIAEELLKLLLNVQVTEVSPDTLEKVDKEVEYDGGLRQGQLRVNNLAHLIQLSDTRCGDQVVNILTDDMSLLGVGNTGFLQRQVEWRTISSEAERWDYVRGMVEQDLYGLYIDLPEIPDSIDLLNQIETVVNFDLPAIPDTRKKVELQDFTADVQAYLYGTATSTGVYSRLFGDFTGEMQKGELYEVLGGVHGFQKNMFQQRLQAWVTYTLNERSEVGSGLACVITALQKLEHDLRMNLDLLETVFDEMPRVDNIREQCVSAFDNVMGGHTGCLGMFTNFQNVVRGWWELERDHIRIMNNRRTLQRMIETQTFMLDYVSQQVLPNARLVEAKLVTGDRVRGINSVYEHVAAISAMEAQRAELDKMAEGIISTLDVPNEYDAAEVTAIEDVLARMSWKVTADSGIQLLIDLPEIEPIVLNTSVGSEGREDVRAFTNSLVRVVADRVLSDSRMSAIERMREKDAKYLDRELAEVSESKHLLYTPTSKGGVPDQARRTFYLQCAYLPDEFDSLQQTIDGLSFGAGEGDLKGIVRTENSHKVVAFHALELLHPEDFEQWRKCHQAYWNRALRNQRGYKADPKWVRCSHLFNAEKEAFYLEYQIKTDSQYEEVNRHLDPFFTLNSRVVHPLEYRTRVTNFLQAWTLGFVQEKRGANQSWLLAVPEISADRPYVLDERTRDSNRDTDILRTLTRFVYHDRDLHDIRYSHNDITEGLNNEFNSWMETEESSLELMERFAYESAAASALADLLDTRKDIEDPSSIERKVHQKVSDLQKQFKISSLYMPDEQHIALAEAVALDALRVADGADSREPFVHLLRVVLPLLYDDLKHDVEAIRRSNRWVN